MTQQIRFSGAIAAFLTPLSREGKLLRCGVEQLVEYQIKGGMTGFYVGGSTGLGMMLTRQERMNLLECVIDAVAGRLPVIVHVGSTDTDTSVALARHARAKGAAALSAVPPYYYKHTEDAIKRYYLDILAAGELPLLVYNIPHLAGVSLGMDFITDLMQYDNVIGLKFTDTNMETVWKLKQWENGRINLMTGYDGMLVCGLAMGADGGIGSYYNVMPKAFAKVYESFRGGDFKTAMETQHKIDFYIDIVRKYAGRAATPALYTILRHIGIDAGVSKQPMHISRIKEAAMIEHLNREGFFTFIQ